MNAEPRKGSFRCLAWAALVVSLSFHAPSSAVVINDSAGTTASIALATPFANVVELSFAGGGLCSGSLISDIHVLTAEHCTSGGSPAAMTVNFHLDNDGVPDLTSGVSAKAEFAPTNVLLDGTDIAVLTLSSIVDMIAPFTFLTDFVNRAVAEMVGFGLSGLGSTGATTLDGLRHAAENVVDSYGPAMYIGGTAFSGTANIVNTDFDNGTSNTLAPGVPSSPTPIVNEGTTAPGDSGGPLLIDGMIAGVLSAGLSPGLPSGFGDLSYWTGTFESGVREFISTATNGKAAYANAPRPPPTPVPLLGTFGYLVVGMLLIVSGMTRFGVQRRQRP